MLNNFNYLLFKKLNLFTRYEFNKIKVTPFVFVDIIRNYCTTDEKNYLAYLKDGIQKGNRSILAKSITLIETEHKGKRKLANKLMQEICKESLNNKKSYRIGFTGPPGAGKSTFIELFGKFLTGQGFKVAVLAVDPSSVSSGGSILGDKTRMPELTRDINAFIRPSPARGFLGGVTRSTNESIALCEYGGYDFIFVETVGVGQSEFAVTEMVDIFILLLPPGGGDELQGVKRGIIEKADIIIVTKSDGDLEPASFRAQYEYSAALKFMRPKNTFWKPKVIRVSSKTKLGLDEFWNTVGAYKTSMSSEIYKKRGRQRKIWMWTHIEEEMKFLLLSEARLKKLTLKLEDEVEKGLTSPGSAADQIMQSFTKMLTSNTPVDE